MKRQRSLDASTVATLTSPEKIRAAIELNRCVALSTGAKLSSACDVAKRGSVVECGARPGAACHVKDATIAFRRMGDMGKLPTSAWLAIWEQGLGAVIQRVCAADAQPATRAQLLVNAFAGVHRVGEKLATLFVGSLSTPTLACDSSPWSPAIDGNELVVVDTNAATAIGLLEPRMRVATYAARATWIRERAANIDLRMFNENVPAYSPRLFQQALYWFCSRSNRTARSDLCVAATKPCSNCASTMCPFARSAAVRRTN